MQTASRFVLSHIMYFYGWFGHAHFHGLEQRQQQIKRTEFYKNGIGMKRRCEWKKKKIWELIKA